MQVFRHINQKYSPSFLTIGNYDGIHLGHQAILKKLISESFKIHGITDVECRSIFFGWVLDSNNCFDINEALKILYQKLIYTTNHHNTYIPI